MLLDVFITCIKLSESSAFLGKKSLIMFSMLIGLFKCSSYSICLGRFHVLNNDSVKVSRFASSKLLYFLFSFLMLGVMPSLIPKRFSRISLFYRSFQRTNSGSYTLMYCLRILWFLFLFLFMSVLFFPLSQVEYHCSFFLSNNSCSYGYGFPSLIHTPYICRCGVLNNLRFYFLLKSYLELYFFIPR